MLHTKYKVVLDAHSCTIGDLITWAYPLLFPSAIDAISTDATLAVVFYHWTAVMMDPSIQRHKDGPRLRSACWSCKAAARSLLSGRRLSGSWCHFDIST